MSTSLKIFFFGSSVNSEEFECYIIVFFGVFWLPVASAFRSHVSQ